jgi:hypothetical protein
MPGIADIVGARSDDIQRPRDGIDTAIGLTNKGHSYIIYNFALMGGDHVANISRKPL